MLCNVPMKDTVIVVLNRNTSLPQHERTTNCLKWALLGRMLELRCTFSLLNMFLCALTARPSEVSFMKTKCWEVFKFPFTLASPTPVNTVSCVSSINKSVTSPVEPVGSPPQYTIQVIAACYNTPSTCLSEVRLYFTRSLMLKLDLTRICTPKCSHPLLFVAVLFWYTWASSAFYSNAKQMCGGKNMMYLSYSLSLRLLCLHVQIPPDKPAYSLTMGCPVQRHSGVKPTRSASPNVTKFFTPKLAPCLWKHTGAPRGDSSAFRTPWARADLLPWCAAHKNIIRMSSSSPLRKLFFRRGAMRIFTICTPLNMMKHRDDDAVLSSSETQQT